MTTKTLQQTNASHVWQLWQQIQDTQTITIQNGAQNSYISFTKI